MKALIMLLLISLLLLFPACTNTLEINVDPIPSELNTNVPKISGKVSNPNATVYVNSSKAIVLEDGTFFAYVDIPPRVSTKVEVRAESSGKSVTKSFNTIFYPKPFLWILNQADTRTIPAKMDGWVSYPDAQIELTGNLKDPEVDIHEDGFFTATFYLNEGFKYPGSDLVRYEITARAITSRGTTSNFTEYTVANSAGSPNFMLNDVPRQSIKVSAQKGKTVLTDIGFQYEVSSPTETKLEIVPDLKKGPASEDLNVSIEPVSLLEYPGTSRVRTLIIRADDKIPSGSYFFSINGYNVEIIVE